MERVWQHSHHGSVTPAIHVIPKTWFALHTHILCHQQNLFYPTSEDVRVLYDHLLFMRKVINLFRMLNTHVPEALFVTQNSAIAPFLVCIDVGVLMNSPEELRRYE